MDLMIKCNVGSTERLLRFGLGAAAGVGAYAVEKKGVKGALAAVSFAGFATALSRYCPMNQLLGIDHCQPAYRSVRQMLRRI